ncbi:hypothetical protein PFISCL1PPCAC_18313, partial [Pristionchus fissidentatus]
DKWMGIDLSSLFADYRIPIVRTNDSIEVYSSGRSWITTAGVVRTYEGLMETDVFFSENDCSPIYKVSLTKYSDEKELRYVRGEAQRL